MNIASIHFLKRHDRGKIESSLLVSVLGQSEFDKKLNEYKAVLATMINGGLTFLYFDADHPSAEVWLDGDGNEYDVLVKRYGLRDVPGLDGVQSITQIW